MEDDFESETRFKLRLSKDNWHSEFKEKFILYAMTCGEAGGILMRGRQLELMPPARNMRAPRMPLGEDGTHRREENGEFMVADQLVAWYGDSERGDRNYEKYEKRYETLLRGKRKLISTLMRSMDVEVYDLVTTTELYERALQESDLYSIWRMTERAVTGNVATSVYALVMRLFRHKQEGLSFAKYDKDFKSMVRELQSQGTAEQREGRYFNALYLMGVNQEQFKDRLSVIYGTREWPAYGEVSTQFHQYAEAHARLSEIRAEKADSIAANATKAGGSTGRTCWNCLGNDHIARDCRKAKHKCSNCGQVGHHERFCREDNEKGEEPRKMDKKLTYPRQSNKKEGEGRKSSRGRMLKKLIAQLTSCDDEQSDVSKDSDSEPDEGSHEAEVFMVTCDTGGLKHQREDSDSQAVVTALSSNRNDESLFVIDSGCRGAHVLKDDSVLDTKLAVKKRRRMPTVESASGHHMITTDAGTIAALDGVALVTPEAGNNLLSLMEIVKYNGGTFGGNKDSITVKDSSGRVILKGYNRGNDLWTCTDTELKSKFGALLGDAKFDDNEGQPEDADGMSEKIPVEDLKAHLTTEERVRAEEAFKLCARLRHPGDKAIIDILNNSLIPGCVLTSRDFQNARKFLGRCPACVEGKMRADTLPSSQAEPARTIGERVYVDLVPLSGKSIGGNTLLCIAVDEKSSYGICIPIPSKTEKHLAFAGEVLTAAYAVCKHRLQQICTDDEVCLRHWGKRLAEKGVRVTATPAGLHCKRVERYIQTVKARRRAVLAGLYYEMPAELEAESFVDVVYWSNALPNTSTGERTTPARLFTGVTSFMPDIPFGTHGLFFNGKEDKKRRAVWGIFLGYGGHKRYMRVYDPLTKSVRSCHKFEMMDTEVPPAWGFRPRLRQTVQRLPAIVAAAPTEGVKTVERQDSISSDQLPIAENPVAVRFDFGGAKTVEQQDSISSDEAPIYDTTAWSDPESAKTAARQDSIATDDTPVSPMANTDPAYSPPAISQEGEQASSVPAGTRTSTRLGRSTWKDGPVRVRDEPYKTRRSGVLNSFSAAVRVLAMLSREHSPEEKQTEMDRKRMENMLREAPTEIGAPEHTIYGNCLDSWHVVAMRASLKQAMKDNSRRSAILASIYAEIDNLEQPGILTPVMYNRIPKDMTRHIIGVYMFHKEKFKADGTFDKDKTRLVLLSNRRDENTIGETHCPTVNPISVMTQLNLAAVNSNTLISAYDIKGAFLLAKMEDRRMFMRVGPEVVKYWTERLPQRKEMVHSDGCLYFELNRYVYGLHEAPRAFNGLLDKTLQRMGMQPTKSDVCLYTKAWKKGKIILSVHVDDMLLTTPDVTARMWFEREIKRNFEIVIQYDTVSYLGMSIRKNVDGSVVVDQEGFLTSLLKKFKCNELRKYPSTPTSSDMLTTKRDSGTTDKSEYLSIVMSLMYLARFTRPDILFSVSYLASKCSSPTADDRAKLIRVLRYLGGTRETGLVFDSKVPFDPHIDADASHHLYESGHGQQALLISNGSAPVGGRSVKIRMITRSSSESELVCLEEASTYAVWYSLLLSELGVSMNRPLTIFQDNKSTILMAAMGPSFKRTKHLIGKRSFVRERLADNQISLAYKSTREMTADLLTKPIAVAAFKYLTKKIGLRNVGKQVKE